MKIITITLLCFCSLFSYSQLQIDIGVDKVFCEKDSGIFICTVISGTPATYTWISTIANFTAPNSPTTRASFSASGEVILKVTSGTMVAYDTAVVFINPLPIITLIPFSESAYCDNRQDISLTSRANPSGSTGTWTCSNPPALVGGDTFSPSKASIKGSPITFTYNYIAPATGCKNKDSISVTVDPKPILKIPNDTSVCRLPSISTRKLYFPSSALHTSGLVWGVRPWPGSDKVSLGNDPAIGKTTFSFDDATSIDTFYLFFVAGGLASCPSISDMLQVITTPSANCVLSTDYVLPSSISIYPNPSTGKFTLEGGDNYTLSVTDVLGKEVKIVQTTDSQFSISETGLFIVHLRSNQKGQSYTQKVIVR